MMPRIPKVVGVKIRAKEGLWKDFGERLRGCYGNPLKGGRRRERRAKAQAQSTVRLRAAFKDEDEGE